MTNEEILANRRNVYAAELGGNTNVIPLCEIEELLELARADERAKFADLDFSKAVLLDERAKFTQAIELLSKIADMCNGCSGEVGGML